MRKCIKKRPKALFGEAAATITAAGINAAATLAGASMAAAAQKRAAKEQANATIEGAKQEADSIKDQTRESKLNFKEQQAFQKEQNDARQQFDKVQQMNMLRQLGSNQANDTRESAMIQVRNGGRYASQVPLRGVNNEFTVTDGGYTKYLGKTPNGENLYEIKGDTHEEHHKTKGGKYKTGVGIRFKDGGEIEGEGAPKGKTGEYMVTGPNGIYFLSRHTLKGFNPVDAVKNGNPPVEVLKKQEAIKTRYGISNSDKKAEYGVELPQDINFENFMPNEETNIFRNGGRKKAKDGDTYRNWFSYRYNDGTDEKSEYKSGLTNAGAATIGNAINATANVAAGLITNIAGNRARNTLNDAARERASILNAAYDNIKGINPDSIDWSSWRPQHAMAFTRDARVNVNPELTSVERSEQRMADNIRKNTSSSAAKLSRLNTLGANANDARSRIFGEQSRQEEAILQRNADKLSETSRFNAQLDSNANMQIGQAKLNLMQQNNALKNSVIEKKALANAEAASEIGRNNANLRMSRANNWASLISGAASQAANTMNSVSNSNQEFEHKMLTGAKETIDNLKKTNPELFLRHNIDPFKFGGKLNTKYYGKRK